MRSEGDFMGHHIKWDDETRGHYVTFEGKTIWYAPEALFDLGRFYMEKGDDGLQFKRLWKVRDWDEEQRAVDVAERYLKGLDDAKREE